MGASRMKTNPADEFIKDFDKAIESWWKRVKDQIKTAELEAKQ